MKSKSIDAETVRQTVRQGYGQIAQNGGSCCGSTPTCCGSSPVASDDLAKHIGYSSQELAGLPGENFAGVRGGRTGRSGQTASAFSN
jgi:hypothetical protein